MSLLPSSKPSVDPTQTGDIQVLGVEGDDTTAVLDALGSETARSLFRAIHEDPGTPTALADAIDTSVQNVLYHLGKLEDADLIQVADTQYSEKGREMNVYAPADNPLVIFVGSEERERGFRALLKRLFGAVAVLTLSSALFYAWVERMPFLARTGAEGPEPEPVVGPGLAFFLGGLTMVLVLGASWYWNKQFDRRGRQLVTSSVLSGQDIETSRRVLIGSSVLFAILGCSWLIQAILAVDFTLLGSPYLFGAGLVTLVVLAAGNAYWNEGLLISWLLVFLPICSLSFYGIGVALRTGTWSTAVGGILFGLLVGVIGALTIGSVGHLIGIGGRRMIGVNRELTVEGSS